MIKTPAASQLRELSLYLSYDPEAGIVYWRRARGGSCTAGSRAGSAYGDGYRRIALGKMKYREHHVAWFLATGRWPDLEIDHANGDKCDNRLSNLRLATPSQNRINRPSNRKSGLRGVYFDESTGRYQARIGHLGKRPSLGYFSTEEEAHSAYRAAAVALYGAFARFD